MNIYKNEVWTKSQIVDLTFVDVILVDFCFEDKREDLSNKIIRTSHNIE